MVPLSIFPCAPDHCFPMETRMKYSWADSYPSWRGVGNMPLYRLDAVWKEKKKWKAHASEGQQPGPFDYSYRVCPGKIRGNFVRTVALRSAHGSHQSQAQAEHITEQNSCKQADGLQEVQGRQKSLQLLWFKSRITSPVLTHGLLSIPDLMALAQEVFQMSRHPKVGKNFSLWRCWEQQWAGRGEGCRYALAALVSHHPCCPLLSCWLQHQAPAGKLPPNACTITGISSGFPHPSLDNDGAGTSGQASLLS